jgi:hypothetical protein
MSHSDYLESTTGKLTLAGASLILLFSLGFVATNFFQGSFVPQEATNPASTSSDTVTLGGNDTAEQGFFQGTLLSGQEGCFDSTYDNCYQASNSYQRASVEALIQSDTPDVLTQRNGVWLVEEGESIDYACGEPEPVGSMYHDTYIFHGTPSFTWDGNGDGTPDSTAPQPSGDYTELSDNEGSLEIDWRNPKQLEIVCLAYDEHWGGDWVWQWKSINWDDPYKVASDTDQDGIYDYNDNCPNKPGTEATNGCPDSDGDGVKDSQDAFPNDPECQSDSDRDGVCDSKDEYPNDPSRQYDSDSDGVADSNDDCPETPGMPEKDGCPNEEPEIVSLDGERNVTLNNEIEYSVDYRNPDNDDISVSWSNGESGDSATYSWNSTGLKTVSVSVDDGFTTVSEEVRVQVGEKSFWDSVIEFFGNIWSVLTFSG